MSNSNPSSTNSSLLYGVLVIALIALGLSVYQFITPKQIAFVESNVLLAEYSESKEAREELNTRIEEWQANVTTLNNELEALNTELVEQAEGWSQSQRDTHLQTMQQKQQELGRYSQAVNQRAAELEAELMDPVYATINNRVEAFAKEYGYSLVFGTVQGGNILYGAETVNATWDFINYLEGDE
ncbi:MAG: OmpH family outer membrane protein [Balneola sp.]|nr:MAG: OmpH family outer membrane protein [Balneola sp.]